MTHFFPSLLEVGQKQQSRLTPQLVMSARMAQAIHLLQLPVQELEPFITEQIVLNPILELSSAEEEDGSSSEEELPQDDEEKEVTISDQDLSILNRLAEEWQDHFAQNDPLPTRRSSQEDQFKAYLEHAITAHPSLYERLLEQAQQTFNRPEEMHIAEILIGYIDAAGFLTTPMLEICQLHGLAEEPTKHLLHQIQTFEPYGVGGASIQESLLIQLRCLNKTDTLAYRLLRDHYDDVLHNRFHLIQKKLKCSGAQIQQAIEQDIARLNVHPGLGYVYSPTQVVMPDVTLYQNDAGLAVRVEQDHLAPLRLNLRYLKMINDPLVPAETKRFLKHHLFSARWLARSLQQRCSTIERIAHILAEKQRAFFSDPNGKMVPLTMKTLSDELHLHESTIARAVANKYIDTPRGLFPLRLFFTGKYVSEQGEDLSAATVKQNLQELVAREDKQHPLSDQALSLLLKQQGIVCARRTVSKYRSLLRIPDAKRRKQFPTPLLC